MSTGIDPKQWGPSGWYLIHGLAMNVKDTIEVRVYYEVVKSLREILPCEVCRGNLTYHLSKMPVPKRTTVRDWTVELHNRVNESRGVGRQTTVDLAAYSHVTWDDMATFLLAILETHPSAWKCTPQYMTALKTFWQGLTELMGERVILDAATACSRKEMRAWARRVGVRQKGHVKMHVCKNDVCAITR
jgi:Erv1 / Alr family